MFRHIDHQDRIDYENIRSLREKLESSCLLGKRFHLDEPSEHFHEGLGNCIGGTIQGQQSAVFQVWCSGTNCHISLRPESSTSSVPEEYLDVIIDDKEKWLSQVEAILWNLGRKYSEFFETTDRPFTPTPPPSPDSCEPMSFYTDFNKEYDANPPQCLPVPRRSYRNKSGEKLCDMCGCTDCFHPGECCERRECNQLAENIKFDLETTFFTGSKYCVFKEMGHNDLHFSMKFGQYTMIVYFPEELTSTNTKKDNYLAVYTVPAFEGNDPFLGLHSFYDVDQATEAIVGLLEKIASSSQFLPPAPAPAPAPAPEPGPAPAPEPGPAPAPEPAPEPASVPALRKARSSCTMC